MMLENIKNVIIGSGEGGKFLAWHLARSGEPAAVIERRMIGGSCPNTNCLPSKNEIWSATVAHLTRHANAFGVDIAEQDVSVDMVAVRQRKRDMVEGLIQLHLDNFRSSGTELVMGNATLIGERLLEVQLNDGGTRTISADRLFLNLGTHATIPAVPGLVEAQPMTHVDLLELDRVPAYLVVVGGGYVGLEFAQAFRRFGSQVTVLQHGSQLLSNQDDDVSSEISLALRDEGIEIVTSVDIKSVTGRSGLRVGIDLCTPDGDRRINASHILVAAGRT
ncbi:FAD-dependent oxidoreductase [Allorhodopirellula heiligendammensis]|uniref:Mercuric reductase n=1 Tax=Allorhodopirellula heiligendammensis TaxID=2714739 RepID=A0A5C6BCJ5_9BACT|nr:FAD-dependent oxidoreductase [Allorhodopirellula heiligendammensis]TWU09758.1 Mercuric reductase [Allorhodopirellula heiligendammensis]